MIREQIFAKYIGQVPIKIKAVPLHDSKSISGTYQSEINIKFSFWKPWVVIRPNFKDPSNKDSLVTFEIFESRKSWNNLVTKGGRRIDANTLLVDNFGKLESSIIQVVLQNDDELQTEQVTLTFQNQILRISGEMPLPFVEMQIEK